VADAVADELADEEPRLVHPPRVEVGLEAFEDAACGSGRQVATLDRALQPPVGLR